MLNAVIAGNIGKDAETRQAGSSTVTSFAVAVEQRGKDGKKTQWVNCSMWGSRGEKLVGYLTKGSRVCASGELTTREYNGKTYLELNVSDVTLMGGGQERQQSQQEQKPQRRELDDEIPF
jgi:single-strand DNA-binding protein